MDSKVRNLVKLMNKKWKKKQKKKKTPQVDWYEMEDLHFKYYIHKQKVKFDRAVVNKKETDSWQWFKNLKIDFSDFGVVNGVKPFINIDRLGRALTRYNLKERSYRIFLLKQLMSLGPRDTVF